MLTNISEDVQTLRCKIDSKYDCLRHLTTIPTNMFTSNPCLSCPIFAHSKQYIFKNGGETGMSEFMNKLHEKALDQPEMMPLADVPDQIKVKLTDAKMKVDSRGNECVFLYLKTTKAEMIVQKYPPSAFKPLEDAIQSAGGYDALKATFLDWKKQTIGRLKFDRLLPLPKPKEKKA